MKSILITMALLSIALLASCSSDPSDPGNPVIPEDVAGNWEGTWQSSIIALGGQFQTTITQDESSISGQITIPVIGMQNAQLQGSIEGSSITFGDVDGRIVFTGTVSEESGSGTYVFPEQSDNGTWNAENNAQGNQGGDLDWSLGLGGFVVSEIRCEVQDVAIQPDGKILVAGNGLSDFSQRNDDMIIRYNASGGLDPAFGTDGVASFGIDGSQAHLTDLVLLPDGKMLMAGRTENMQVILRVQADGVLDTSFGVGGILSTDLEISEGENPALVQSDGTLIVASGGLMLRLLAFDTSGDPKTDFGASGEVTIDPGAGFVLADMAIVPDDGMTVCGNAGNTALIWRFSSDGSLDLSFGDGGLASIDLGEEFVAEKCCVQDDGKLILTGFTGGWFSPIFAMIRLTSDGSLDPSFGDAGLVREPDVDQFSLFEGVGGPAMQSDGKIVVAGVGNMVFSLFRFTADGSRDQDFGTGGAVTTNLGSTGGWDHAREIVVQEDGKIVVAGCAGTASVALVRYCP